MEYYLQEKREELVRAMSEQDYTNAQLARLFNTDRMTISRIINNKPKDYKPKWFKNE